MQGNINSLDVRFLHNIYCVHTWFPFVGLFWKVVGLLGLSPAGESKSLGAVVRLPHSLS